MQVGTSRFPLYAVGLTLLTAATLAGCAGSASSGAGSTKSSAATAASPLEEVKLAAQTAQRANTFTGTIDLRMTAAAGAASTTGTVGDMSMTMAFAERLHPSLLVSVNVGSLSSAGMTLPGQIAEILTPTAVYIKWPYLNQSLHVSKPWLSIPFSALNKSTGINFSQFVNQANGNSPLTQSQLFAGASSVHKVGTGTIDGVPVTEYSGTVPLAKAIAGLTGNAKSQLQQQVAAAGFTTATFTEWIDNQHQPRKAVITEVGTSVTENITMKITSINQPVNITVPPASQTSPLPASLS